MGHGIAPSPQARFPEPPGTVRVVIEFAFRRDQAIAVKIDPVSEGIQDPIGDVFLFQVKRLVGEVCAAGVDGPVIVHGGIELTAFWRLDVIQGNAFVVEHGQQFRVPGAFADPHPPSDHVLGVADARSLHRHEHQRRVLKDHRQHHHGVAPEPPQQHFAVGNPVLNPAGQHLRHRIRPGIPLPDLDGQPRFPEIPLGRRRVIACELELMEPFELKNDGAGFVFGAG